MLLAESWRWGADGGSVRSLLPAAGAALAWADEYGDRDGDCFIEYQRATTSGPIHQGWKDSFDAINDAEGRLAEPTIALCDVQGYLCAALLGRAELAEAFGDPAAATRLRDRADTLRGKFLKAFWLPERVGTPSLWMAANVASTRCPATSPTACGPGSPPTSTRPTSLSGLSHEEMDSGVG